MAVAACALADRTIKQLSVDTQGYRFQSITQIRDVNLLPGAIKYGDLPAMLALCASTNLVVAGETSDSIPVTMAASRAAGGSVRFATAVVDLGASIG